MTRELLRFVWPAPVLLVVVALAQIVATSTADLTSWIGGGFGMFSRAEDRRVLVHLLEGDRCYSDDAVYPPALETALQELAVQPTEAALRALAEELLDGRWTFHVDVDPVKRKERLFVRPADAGPPPSTPMKFTAVELQVVWARFDARANEVSAQVVRKVRHEVPR